MIMCEINEHHSIHENQIDKTKDQSKTMRGNNIRRGMDSITYPLMAHMNNIGDVTTKDFGDWVQTFGLRVSS